MCTIGHTCTGSCICIKSVQYGYYFVDVNPECPMAGHSREVFSVAFSPDGKHFVSGSCDNLAKIWDTETGAEVMSSLVGSCLRWWGGGFFYSIRPQQFLPIKSSERMVGGGRCTR